MQASCSGVNSAGGDGNRERAATASIAVGAQDTTTPMSSGASSVITLPPNGASATVAITGEARRQEPASGSRRSRSNLSTSISAVAITSASRKQRGRSSLSAAIASASAPASVSSAWRSILITSFTKRRMQVNAQEARAAVARATQVVNAWMLETIRHRIASGDRDRGYSQPPRGLDRAEERAWVFLRDSAAAVVHAESSIEWLADAKDSYPEPDDLTGDARKHLEALIELDEAMAEERREALIDLIRALEKASAWASLRGAIALCGGGRVRVAGVSQSQDILRALGGWRQSRVVTALLVPQPDNPHDANAIAVYVASRGARTSLAEHVGYIPRDLAAEYAADFARLRDVATGGYCNATIVGGFPLFDGVSRRPRRGRAARVGSRTIPSGMANLGLRLDLAEAGAILRPARSIG